MLAFTPRVERALRWFDDTHELISDGHRCWFKRTGLPGPGNIGEQNARLMAELDYLRRLHDEMVAPKRKTQPDET